MFPGVRAQNFLKCVLDTIGSPIFNPFGLTCNGRTNVPSAIDRHKLVAKMYFVFQTKHTTAGGGKGPIKLSGQTANNATVESVRHDGLW
jgi:hypothetical protein